MTAVRRVAGRMSVVVCLILAGGVVASTGLAESRIVIIAGKPSHPPGMHEFRAGALLLQKALTGFPGVKLDVYTHGWPTRTDGAAVVDDDAALDGAAAVVIYADGGKGHPAFQGRRASVIERLAARGVGLGFMHYGVDVPEGDQGAAMQRWIGGYYETNFSVNPMWSPAFTQLPVHPVTRGVAPFGNYDEWYFNMRWTPDQAARGRLTSILTAVPSDEVRRGPYVNPRGPYPHIVADSGRVETMMWVYEGENGGRGFGFTGGHSHANWGDPNQRRVVLNALLWVARVDVPPAGVQDAIGPADLTSNLDPKPAQR